MTDPDRLLKQLDDESPGASMLRSAREDAPREAARRRTAMALGLAVGVTAASTAATTTAAAAASKWSAYGGTAALIKWIGIGAVSGVMAVGAVEYVSAEHEANDAPATTAPMASTAPAIRSFKAPSPVPVLIPPAIPDEPHEPASAAAPTLEVPQAIPRAKAPTPPSAAPHVAPVASSLADEVRDLDRARALLAAGNARATLSALDAHDRTFADGALAPEAAVLRIEALTQAGDDAAATARANAFLATYPSSPQARRVRSVLEAIRTPPPVGGQRSAVQNP